jgi:hypothetical protein
MPEMGAKPLHHPAAWRDLPTSRAPQSSLCVIAVLDLKKHYIGAEEIEKLLANLLSMGSFPSMWAAPPRRSR